MTTFHSPCSYLIIDLLHELELSRCSSSIRNNLVRYIDTCYDDARDSRQGSICSSPSPCLPSISVYNENFKLPIVTANLCRNYIEQIFVTGIFLMHFIINNFGYYISIYLTIVSISLFDNLKPFFFYLKFPIHYRVTSYLIINLKIFAWYFRINEHVITHRSLHQFRFD